VTDKPDHLSIAVGLPLSQESLDVLRSSALDLDVRYDPELYELRPGPEQDARFAPFFDDVDVLLGVPYRAGGVLARAVRTNPRLRWVHTIPAGGGQQVRDAELTPEELARVVFTTSAGIHARPLSEFALFGVLAGAKRLRELDAARTAHHWAGDVRVRMLDDMTVLVVGMGGIGLETARRLQALGCTVVGVSRHDVEGFETVRPDGFADAAALADAIVMALPGTELTKGMLGADVLSRVNPGTTVVNVGRGNTIDEPALIAALEDGRVGLAVLDVTAVEPLPQDSPLWTLPNVMLAPHIAAKTEANDIRIAHLFLENARRLLAGEELLNRVNTVEFY
jgi:phosphoglycerate dehydrogenase-like enzyme